MIKKRYVVIFLLAFCLTATLFIAIATSGRKENPWDIISELQTKVEALESRVETLEGQLPPQGFLTAPAYDSGWMHLQQNIPKTLQHNLNTTSLLVYVLCENDHAPDQLMWLTDQVYWRTPFKSLNTIELMLRRDSIYRFRVWIWAIPD